MISKPLEKAETGSDDESETDKLVNTESRM